MKITVHRGSNQIGGCVTEYESNGWRLFVDYGEQLPGSSTSDKPFEVEGLIKGDLSKSALLITHYHGDHIGKIAELSPKLPIFMGAISKEIALELYSHLGHISENHRRIAKRLETVNTFNAGEPFTFGDFRITPIVIDHSAFDAYAFSIESKDTLKAFHTGDFRTHGFRSSKLPKVIEKYVGRVDYVVCEATNVNRPDATQKSEHELQKEFEKAFTESKYNVVYVSSTNIDRLFGLYHAAVKAHRPFYVDAYQKKIMDIVAGQDNIWGKSRLYNYVEGKEPKELHRDSEGFKINDKFKQFLEKQGYVLIARANDRFDSLLSEMPSAGRMTFFSMWKGYLDSSKAAYNPELAKSVGNEYEYLHTSGHCNMESIDKLLDMLNPKAIIPIHTDNPRRFAEIFSDKWPVILLDDGESFTAIHDPGFDVTLALVLAYKEPDCSYEVIENADNLKFRQTDFRCLGEFQCWNDADYALRHVVYAPQRLLAYSIEADEDMSPWLYVMFNPDFTELSEYNNGGHSPEGGNFQNIAPYSPGDRVLVIIDDLLVPSIVVGPLTNDYLRKEYEKDDSIPKDSFEDYLDQMWDWDWDKIIVRPLIKIKTPLGEISSETPVQRLNVFPYRDL